MADNQSFQSAHHRNCRPTVNGLLRSRDENATGTGENIFKHFKRSEVNALMQRSPKFFSRGHIDDFLRLGGPNVNGKINLPKIRSVNNYFFLRYDAEQRQQLT